MSEDRRHVTVTDPRALKALAHPGRNKILGHLQAHGSATATDCAEVAGMSPSACSYHLRLLEKYGFVEEARDEQRTDGRERLWRAAVHGWTSDVGSIADPAEARAIDMALTRAMLDTSDENVLAWVDAAGGEPREWREAWLVSNDTIVATAEELRSLGREIQRVLSPYAVTKRAERPEGARLVHAALRLTPAPHRRTES
jgi:DNA-binding transcriptional ArsR family regulator